MLFLHRSINIFVFVVSCCMSVIYLRCGEADLHCDTHHDQLPLIKTRATPQHHSPSLSDVWSRVRDRPSVSFFPRSTCTTVVVVLIVRRHRNATTPTTPLSPCRPQTHKKKAFVRWSYREAWLTHHHSMASRGGRARMCRRRSAKGWSPKLIAHQSTVQCHSAV